MRETRRWTFAWAWTLGVVLAAAPASAGVVDCASLTPVQRTQAEAIGACGAAPKSICLPATDAGLAALVAWLSTQASYQETVPCSDARVVDDAGILVVAGPGDGTCVLGLFGTEIPNPQPRRQVALRWWRAEINRGITSTEAAAAAEAERQRVEDEAAEALPEEAP